jgi:hypothetical protein
MNFETRKQTILIPLQLGTFTLTLLYLIYSRVEMRRRLCRSWQAIASRLSPTCFHTESTAASLGAMARVRYRDAGVMMEIADYAERNARNLDHILIEELRSDALKIRIGILRTLLLRRAS